MSPTRLPSPRPRATTTRIRALRRLFANPLSAATAISFSLTFVGAGIALLLGFAPATLPLGAGEVDTGVVLLFVPLCALLFAILVEAARTTIRESRAGSAAPRANPMAAWKPGQGEG